MKLYVFTTDSYGKVKTGTQIDADDYTVQGDEQVWLNQERAFYINGSWVIYPRISVTAPAAASINQVVTATATLPSNSPDTEVQFRVAWQDADGTWHKTDPIAVAVSNGQASKDFQLAAAGKYLIEALSEHHGLANVEVVVS